MFRNRKHCIPISPTIASVLVFFSLLKGKEAGQTMQVTDGVYTTDSSVTLTSCVYRRLTRIVSLHQEALCLLVIIIHSLHKKGFRIS